MNKDNLLFKLDNLEYQYHYLNGTVESFEPRLNQTRKLYNSKGRKNIKRVSKVLESLNLDDVNSQLHEIRVKFLDGKVHSLEKNMKTCLVKKINEDKKNKILKVCDSIDDFLTAAVMSKIVKVTVAKIARGKNIPSWFEEHVLFKANLDKEHKWNPSRVRNDIILKIDQGEKLVSQIMNDKKCRELFQTFDISLDTLLGINKDKKLALKQEEKNKKNAIKNKSSDSKKNDGDDDDSDVTDEQEVEEQSSDDRAAAGEVDEEEILKAYEGMLVASEDEDGDDNGVELDSNINYNEVTDEEPSADESESDIDESSGDDDEPKTKKQKTQKMRLPELMAGYYSGEDSDIDSEEDEVAKRQVAIVPQKKNRRGQRARRKIWEQKYGKGANHVQKEFEQKMAERKQRQEDYEARVAKRAARDALRDKNNINKMELKNAKVFGSVPLSATKPVSVPKVHEDHPSWIAKKKAEEKEKNAKFTGKKIVFD